MVTVTRGGCWRLATFGHLGRPGPHLLGAPDADRDDRRAGVGGQPGRPGLALEHRVEERLAPGDGALGQDDDHLAGPQGGAWPVAIGSPGAGVPVDRDPTEGPGQLADHRGVEQLLFAHEAHRAADPGGHQGQGGHVEVAAVVGDEDHRTLGRDVLDPVDGEAGVGEGLGPHERPDQVVRLESDHRRDPGRPVPVLERPPAGQGHGGQPRVGVQRVGVADGARAGARRRSCRSTRGSRPGRCRVGRPTRGPRPACPCPRRTCRPGGRCSGRRPPGSGWRSRRRSRGPGRAGRPGRGARWWPAPAAGPRPGGRPAPRGPTAGPGRSAPRRRPRRPAGPSRPTGPSSGGPRPGPGP